MFWRCFAHLCGLVVCAQLVVGAAIADGPAPPPVPEPTAPPAPQSQLPPIPDRDCGMRCGLLGSDSFADRDGNEALPQCHPLPEIVPSQTEPLLREAAAIRSLNFTARDPALRFWRSAAPIGPHDHGEPRARDFLRDAPIWISAPPSDMVARNSPHEATSQAGAHRSQATPEEPDSLTPVQHLHRAAHHLEAAGHPDEAQHLRERAADMQRHARHRLQELREQKQRIDEEIEHLEQVTGQFEQVLIRVSMLEVDEQKLQKLGITFQTPGSSPVQLTGTHGEPTCELLSAPMAKARLLALRESGAARVLAEPNLVTTDGSEGSVFSGGEMPIFVPQEDGSVLTEHKEFGIRLTATPQILEDGRVRVEIASAVSERDFSNVAEVDGDKVPGITTRRINTLVEMSFGETVVIGGLPVRRRSQTISPILQKIPDQSRLFRKASHASDGQSSTRSLVVFVTAERVRPLSAGPQGGGQPSR